MKPSGAMPLSLRCMHVWRRNLTVYGKIWKISFLPPLLEPCFYLLAFGMGLGALVGDISYQGVKVSYSRFIAPAIISMAIMYNAFFETTYTSFVRMYYQKTFDAIMATPLFLSEIIAGEIAWGATKSIIACAIMMAVVSLFGLIDYPGGLLILPAALLGGLAFASIGMFFTGIVRSIEVFNLPIFLFVTPMFLFSGTFFPLETLPVWAQLLAQAFPLTHLVALVRGACLGAAAPALLGHCLYLIVFSLVFSPLALRAMQRRLVR
jgi:lipooligosaccharide transport system permease protein